MSQPNTSTSPFDRLPQEILAHVASYLDHPDIGHFRVVQKCCATAGLQTLVRNLTLMVSMKSFQNLLNIAKNPVMSQYVKSVWYDAMIMESIQGEEFEAGFEQTIISAWNESMQTDDAEYIEDTDFQPGTPFFEKMTLCKQNLQRLLQEQQAILSSGYDIGTIAVAFSHCRNLQTIVLNTLSDDMHSTTRHVYKECCGLDLIVVPDDLERTSFTVRSFLALPSPAPFLQRLESLALRLHEWEVFNTACPNQVHLICQLFMNLKAIDLTFVYLSGGPNIATHQLDRSTTLGKALKSAQHLEQLSLTYGRPFGDLRSDKVVHMPGFVLLDNVLGTTSWANLGIFKLHGVRIADSFDLSAFLHRHLDSLQSVVLENVRLSKHVGPSLKNIEQDFRYKSLTNTKCVDSKTE